MSSLRESAISALRDAQSEQRTSEVRRREQFIQGLRDDWAEKWRHRIPDTPEIPSEMEWTTVAVEGGNRVASTPCVRFAVDGIPFGYIKDKGIVVMATCPDCGAERAYSFYGMAQLGEILERGRNSWGHVCVTPVARTLAEEIRQAARRANLPPETIVEEALAQRDVIYRF